MTSRRPPLGAIVATVALSGVAVVVSCSLVTESDHLTSGGFPAPDSSTFDGTLVDSASDTRFDEDGAPIDSSISDGGTDAVDATNDASDSDARSDTPLTCPTSETGPPMVKLADFCIDKTEVTQTQYADFLNNGAPLPSTQDSWCTWNTTFVPDGWNPGGSPFMPPAGDPNRPVVSLDWCDAAAYCKWQGKTLCGARPKSAGSTPYLSFAIASADQWMAACSSFDDSKDAGREFPYGDAYVPRACNGADFDATPGLVAAGSIATCATAAGVLDLSGNAAEWENACNDFTPDAGRSDQCRARGGSYASTEPGLRCGFGGDGGVANRETRAPTISFRCCFKP